MVGLETQVTARIVGGNGPSNPTDPRWGTHLGRNLAASSDTNSSVLKAKETSLFWPRDLGEWSYGGIRRKYFKHSECLKY